MSNSAWQAEAVGAGQRAHRQNDKSVRRGLPGKSRGAKGAATGEEAELCGPLQPTCHHRRIARKSHAVEGLVGVEESEEGAGGQSVGCSMDMEEQAGAGQG